MERKWKYMIFFLWRLIVYNMVTIAIETKQFSFCQILLTLYMINRQHVHNVYLSCLWMKYEEVIGSSWGNLISYLNVH